MSGIYGDDPEDKYFERKLLEHQDQYEGVEDEEELKYTELDQEVIDELSKYMDDNNLPDVVFDILDDLILPIVDILVSEGIITPRHLDQHLNDLKIKEKNIAEIKDYTDELEYITGKIVDLTKEK